MEFCFNNTYAFPEKILSFKIIPKHIWESIENYDETAQDWIGNQPEKIIGAGPYVFNNFDELNGTIHLKRNEYYDNWTGIILYFEDVYFEFYSNREAAMVSLENGLVDMIDWQYSIPINEIPSSIAYELVKKSLVHEFALNNIHPYFGTGEYCPISGPESAKHIRKAMSLIIPREMIVEEILDGVGFLGVTPYPNSAFGFDDSLEHYEYNVSLALEHMLAAGFDVTLSPSKTGIFGFNFSIILGIVALIGGIVIYFRKQKKQKL